eukprot:6207312-Pleurochrysis_carterae.AAC.1
MSTLAQAAYSLQGYANAVAAFHSNNGKRTLCAFPSKRSSRAFAVHSSAIMPKQLNDVAGSITRNGVAHR